MVEKIQRNEYSIPAQNDASFIKRFYIYQKERFPLLAHGLLIAAFSFSAIAYSRICRHAPGFIGLKTYLAGIAVTITLFFLLRVLDEFKDAEDDAAYRKELPVPRGLISFRELRNLGIFLVSVQLALNLLFFPKMLLIYSVVLVYLFLMTKEFFVADWLKKHQFWYVTSHMFIIPLVDIYASGLDWFLQDADAPKGLLFFFAVSYMSGIVLELGRKIRIPSEEKPGVLTYTSMLGPNRAVILWLVTLLITLTLSLTAAWFAGHGTSSFYFLAVLFILCAIPALIFIRHKTRKISKAIEISSALWTLAMYLTLGGAPMMSRLISSI